MSIKYIFSDVDFTLVCDQKPISEKNLAAIDYAREKGVNFIISSGRAPSATRPLTDQLHISEHENEFVICSNGALVIDRDYNVVHESNISKENFKIVLDTLREVDCKRIVFTTVDAYYMVDTGHEIDDDFPAGNNKTITYEEALDIVAKQHVYKFLCPFDVYEEADRVGDLIKERTNGALTYAHSVVNEIDINNVDASKGIAIKKILEHTGTKAEETLGIGDNLNDLEMLKAVGIAACPDNAVEDIKKICDYVSDRHCREDAVADIIHKYVKE